MILDAPLPPETSLRRAVREAYREDESEAAGRDGRLALREVS